MATTIVVVFWSRTGTTERLAMTAAVGAVQQRALIRLRWLREEASSEAVAADPEWEENRHRMLQEYIPPREVDIQGADGLVLLTPSHIAADAPEWRAFFDLLTRAGTGKKVSVFGDTLEAPATSAGCAVVPCATPSSDPTTRALELGRSVARACIVGQDDILRPIVNRPART